MASVKCSSMEFASILQDGGTSFKCTRIVSSEGTTHCVNKHILLTLDVACLKPKNKMGVESSISKCLGYKSALG